MIVFKFGGASICDATHIKRVGKILLQHGERPLVVVVSAMGKTTNALETVHHHWFHKTTQAPELLRRIKQLHWQVIANLQLQHQPVLTSRFEAIFETCFNILHSSPQQSFDFHYDQLVSSGELLSSTILSGWLHKIGIDNHWHDARQLIATDAAHREANIDWDLTKKRIQNAVLKMQHQQVAITQGFIGQSPAGHTTTLGREGSDFTAAIFANILEAEKMVIWKDVPGVLDADPRFFTTTTKISNLSYYEAIEMTYYGAKVIHPKTIKPLQNKKIPLHVRSFINYNTEGTIITHHNQGEQYPPVIVLKKNQVLLSIVTKDFSFMAEKNLSLIYLIFADLRIGINTMQNAALSFTACIDDNEAKLKHLFSKLKPHFTTKVNHGLQLLTIRHYNDKLTNQLLKDKEIILEQKSRSTIQFVIK